MALHALGRLAVLLALPAALLVPSMAQAATLCVNKPGCAGETFTEAELQAALDAAASNATHPGPDRIELGPGTYTNGAAGVFTSPNDSVIELVGAGETSVITTGPGAPVGSRVLDIAEETAVVSDVRVEANASVDFPIGLGLAGRAERVSVVDPPGLNSQAGVFLLGTGAVFRDGTIDISGPGGGLGGTGVTGMGTVEDSTIRAGVGSSATITRRVRIVAQNGVLAFSGGAVADQVLIQLEAGPGAGLSVSGPPIGSASLTATHVTIVGDGGGSSGVRASAFAFISPTSSSLTLSNSVIRGVTTAISRTGFSGPFMGTADVTTRYSSYDLTSVSSSGPGTLTASEGNLDDADAKFRGTDDFRLQHGSPLIDVADPAAPGAGESATDLGGEPRVVDGNGDGTARRDMGAFEYQRGAPTLALAVSSPSPMVGEPVSFSAAGSSDPEGEALSFAWSFGGAADPGSGETLVRSFASAGPKTVTLVVTDSAGASATRTATVEVRQPVSPQPPPPPPPECGNEMRGTARRDTLRGGPLGDLLLGLGGRDVLIGGPGDDCLRGAAGADRLRGEGGADRLSGGAGGDRLSGGAGGDRLSGGAGADRLGAGAGKDRLSGGAGADRLGGGAGRDRFSGGAGNDSITARDGRRERVDCGPGQDDVARVDSADRVRRCERVVRPR